MDTDLIEIQYPFEAAGTLLCVPACINMLLRRRGLRVFPQEQIAQELGLVVSPDQAATYPWAASSDQESEWGVHPQDQEHSLMSFFVRHGVDLDELFYRPSHIFGRDYADFIASNLAQGNDVLVGYDFKVVFGAGRHVGHVSIVSGVNSSKALITLIDPERRTPVTASLKILMDGVETVTDGFWVIGNAAGIEWCRRTF